jgi:hypothetical protein
MTGSDRPHRKRSACAAALYAAAFLFFLVYSAPHRVHHFFDQAKLASHNHSEDDHHGSNHNDKSTKEPDCVFQASANRCVFGSMEQVQALTLSLVVYDLLVFQNSAEPQQFLNGVFHIRAPPIA